MKLGFSRKIKVSVIFFCIFFLGLGILWKYTQIHLGERIQSLVKELSQNGYKLSFKEFKITGFPFWFKGTFIAPSIGTKNWIWASESFVVEAPLWRLKKPKIFLSGIQTINLKNGDQDYSVEVKSNKFSGFLKLNEDKIRSLSIFGQNVGFKDFRDRRKIKFDSFKLSFSREQKLKLLMDLRIDGVILQATPSLSTRAKISTVELKMALNGQIPFTLEKNELALWRDSGGTIELKALNLNYKSIQILSGGTVALGKFFQPIGAFTVDIVNIEEIFKEFENFGLIKPKDIFVIMLMLSGISKKVQSNGVEKTRLAITIQDDAVYLGSIKLLKFDRKKWFKK